jgi:Ni,Fe-hydrogenase III large subunit
VVSKDFLGDVFLFHTYMVVARMKIKFGEVLSTIQLIQKVINDMNGKFIFDCEFVEDTKSGQMRQIPSLLSTMTTKKE